MRRTLLVGALALLVIACSETLIPDETAGPVEGEAAMPADPPEFTLEGNRFRPLTWEEMTDAQKRMTMNILDGPRTAMGGPFNVLLRSPEMGDMAQELGAYARFNSTLPGKLREMAIIMTARFWTAQFEWYAHKQAALAEGLDPAIVDAIATGPRPASMDAGETVIYDFVAGLLEDNRVSDAAYRAALAQLGEQGIVDLVGTIGYYSMVSMLLIVDEYPLPEGVEPELEPLP
jgi:4-carboxymuconolactone decarboxylase